MCILFICYSDTSDQFQGLYSFMTMLYILFMLKTVAGGMGDWVEGKKRNVKMKEGGKQREMQEEMDERWMDRSETAY